MEKVAVYAGTRNVYRDMIPAANSLLAHSDVNKIYFLIEDDVFPYELPPKTETINVSGQTYFRKDGPNYNTHWSYMILIKAALSKIFPQYDRILFLDNDTIVNENISRLWFINLNDYYLAAAFEPEKSTEELTFINTGVTLFNLKKLREDKKDDEIIRYLNTISYDYPDQDCLAETCQYSIYELPPDYNISNWVDLEKVHHRKIMHFAANKEYRELPIVKKYAQGFGTFNQPDNDVSLDIIIPAYNDVKGLERTLKSIYNSGWITITVVNDCSKEDYTSIKEQFPSVNFINCETNGGPGKARNIGRKATHQPYIMFVDCGDIIPSKWCLIEIYDQIMHNTMGDLYQWPWINGEYYTISAENSCCTPGVVYRREFLDLYNIWHCENAIGSYSNEDIGFNHTCKAVINDIEGYDLSKHYFFYEMPVYKMIYEKNSLTHKNNKEYLYVRQIPGLAINAEHCIRQLEKANISDNVLLFELNTFMVGLYYDYLYCEKKRPQAAQEQKQYIKDFYLNVYKSYENHELNETYQRMAISQKIKPLTKLTSRVNLQRFLRELNT